MFFFFWNFDRKNAFIRNDMRNSCTPYAIPIPRNERIQGNCIERRESRDTSKKRHRWQQTSSRNKLDVDVDDMLKRCADRQISVAPLHLRLTSLMLSHSEIKNKCSKQLYRYRLILKVFFRNDGKNAIQYFGDCIILWGST